jgi:hypothetical protein
MKATNVNTQEEVQKENEIAAAHGTSKVGTWISVGVVAAVILLTYFVLFGLYMDRV